MKFPSVSFSHLGIHVRDMETMLVFYRDVLGLHVTDRGQLPLPGNPEIVFLSRNPAEHHQIVLVAGREDAGGSARIVNQISFHADSLADLRSIQEALTPVAGGPTFALNHGNGWSLYSHDPEGNMLEFFVDSPWYVQQPLTDFLDLSLSDEEIHRRTEETYRSHPGFQPIEQWRAAFAERIAAERES